MIVMEVDACLILISCLFPVFSTLSATRLLRKCKRIRRPIFYCWNCPFPHGSVDFFFFVFWELKRIDQVRLELFVL